jgi:hypothetical protein
MKKPIPVKFKFEQSSETATPDQVEDAFRILARMMVRAYLEDRKHVAAKLACGGIHNRNPSLHLD